MNFFGRDQHKHDHISYNIIHAKNIRLLDQERQRFRQSKLNKNHPENMVLLKQEKLELGESNRLVLLERNAKWERFKARRGQAVEEYIRVKRTQHTVM